uniref:Reverse transcriptase zinc-binding domain-containing protein n=1 Tax=Pygocentrus nattereri TaxID=42514 RepID=A0AAR2M2X3_PYGNA
MSDDAFALWAKRGVVSLSDLYIDGKFASFEQLTQRYNIPRIHFYRYLQLRNFVSSNLDSFPLSPSISLLESIYKHKAINTQAISIIYGLLDSHNYTSLELLKSKWEMDLGGTILEETWCKIIQGIFSSSICAKHAVIQFKIVHRLHWSKVRLSKIKAGLDPTCDRCGLAPASLLHMFWSCSKLYTFWNSIFETFSKVSGKAVEPSPFIALFGVVPIDSAPNRRDINMFAFCSLLARRLILFKWKDANPPTYNHWVREVLYHLKLEKIRYTLRGSTGKFFDIWQPFLSFVEDFEADSVLTSNGLAESSVKVVKGLMKKAHDGKEDFHHSPMIYRSAPLQNSLSPAQILMGRRLRTNLPMHENLLTPKGAHKIKIDKEKDKEKQKTATRQKSKETARIKAWRTSQDQRSCDRHLESAGFSAKRGGTTLL